MCGQWESYKYLDRYLGARVRLGGGSSRREGVCLINGDLGACWARGRGSKGRQ